MYFGERVKLRAIKKEDLILDCRFLNDEEIKKSLYSWIPFPQTYEEELDWIKNYSKADKGRYYFAIEDLETGTYIGGCGINVVDWVIGIITIDILIGDKNIWGKGYGTDAMKVLMTFIFKEMNMNKIKLEVFSFNERAINCYKKCGFKVEAVLKKEIFREGKYHDNIVMSIMRDEWSL